MSETSYRIMKTSEFINQSNPSIFYKADCACGSPDCQLTLELEYDEEINDLTLSIYNELAYCSWWNTDYSSKFYFLKDIYYRIKGMLKLLFTGKISVEGDFIFGSTKQIDGFIKALEKGKEQIKNGY